MKICDTCGGLTPEPGERIAGTPCKCLFAASAGYAAILDDIEIIRQKIASVKDGCDASKTGQEIDDALWSALMALNRAEAAARNAA